MTGHLVLLHIAGGVALLLWATRMVRTGIMRAYGAELRRALSRALERRLTACGVGIGVAGLLQSGAATALLVNSFAIRGLVGVGAGLALMLGADVGSTLVVQALSFDLSWASPALILAGVVTFLVSSMPKPRHIGRILLGLGLLVLSLQLIVGASAPLRDSEILRSLTAVLSGDPILAVLLGAILTWIAHSSVATVLLIMSFAMTGVIPLGLGFALVLGANIGSGIIPFALSYAGGPAARRIPFGNLLFRTVAALLALGLLSWVAPLVQYLGADPARQIANFHTFFNLALALLFLPLTETVAGLVERLFPGSEELPGQAAPKYLDEGALDTPSVAIASATREALRIADIVEAMLGGVIEVFRKDDTKLAQQISKMDDDVDGLYEAVKLYLTKVGRTELDEEESQRCVELITFTTNLEHIGDIIDKNLIELANKKAKNKLQFSDEGWRELVAMHNRVVEQMKLALSVFVSGDLAVARRLLANKEGFRDLEREGSELHLERLRSGKIESIETSSLHLDILRDLKRINSHLTSVAYPILDAEGELRKSRLKGQAEETVARSRRAMPPVSGSAST